MNGRGADAVAQGAVRDLRRVPDGILDAGVLALDLAVAATGLALLLHALVGPVDLWFFSVSGFAKPFLQFLVLASVRAAVPRLSPVSTLVLALVRAVRTTWRTWTGAGGWTTAALDVAIMLVSTRLVAKAVGVAATLAYPDFIPRSFTPPFEAVAFAETFAAWDSAWYLDIAQRGYTFRADAPSSVAFFPLYPLLIRVGAFLFGGSPQAFWLSAIALSYASFVIALVLLHRLTERCFGSRDAARRAVLSIAVFPFSFPFTRIYTESLFLLVSVGAIFSAVAGRWRLAGACGALATVTRPNGIVLLVPLAIMALQAPWAWRPLLGRVFALLALPAALLWYCAFVYALSGDPLAWLNAQAHWGYSIGNAPWASVQSALESVETQGLYRYLVSSHGALYAFSHAAIGLAVVALTPSVFRRLGPAMGCYVAIGILIPFSGNALEGIGRYASTLFPVFVYLGGAVRSQRTHDALLIGSSLWLALNIGFFVTQRPVY